MNAIAELRRKLEDAIATIDQMGIDAEGSKAKEKPAYPPNSVISQEEYDTLYFGNESDMIVLVQRLVESVNAQSKAIERAEKERDFQTHINGRNVLLAAKYMKERDELQRKWDQRHIDPEIAEAYDAGRKEAEKERDELVAQVVALVDHRLDDAENTILRQHFSPCPGNDLISCTRCGETSPHGLLVDARHDNNCHVPKAGKLVRKAVLDGMKTNLHPATASLMRELEALRDEHNYLRVELSDGGENFGREQHDEWSRLSDEVEAAMAKIGDDPT